MSKDFIKNNINNIITRRRREQNILAKISHSRVLRKLETWLPHSSSDSLILIGAFFHAREKTIRDPNHSSLQ